MKTLTVFTPTYNRAHLLPRLYESIKTQTEKDFVWMLIDDGSTDNTHDLVKNWQEENQISIQYFYKENGGMHTAHNLAYKMIQTELNVCIDSDDWMPHNAVEIILQQWELANEREISGFIGLDADQQGEILGTRMPKDETHGTYYDLYHRSRATGDKKFVLITREVREYPPYPEYAGEKLVPLGILYVMMGESKPFIYIDQTLCVVEYQPTGSSNTIVRQYFQSPRGFAYAKKIRIKYSPSFFETVKNILHLGALWFISRDKDIIWKENQHRLMTLLLMPASFILFKYFQLRR